VKSELVLIFVINSILQRW